MAHTETMQPPVPPGSSLSALPRLRVLYAPGEGIVSKGQRHSLPVGTTYLGRELPAAKEGIELGADRALSAVHALIEVDDQSRVLLTDCGSKNGTSRNGEPLKPQVPCLLADGDVVRMGHTFVVLRHEPAAVPDVQIPGLIGISPAMRTLRTRIARLAGEPESVLILGETGTGKERAARALHDLGQRAGEFVAINCSAIPAELAESELFGHERNAFTGATERLGCFRRAAKGTLLLDEVGDMPAEIQPKLLRVLQEHVIKPIGADRELRCDVRVIAATNHDLQSDVESGEFRHDLLERLGRFTLLLAPLRERREDILLLLDKHSADKTPALPHELVDALLTYDWPGNVRELQTVAAQLRVEGVSQALLSRLRQRTEREPTPVVQAASPRPHRLQLPEKEVLAEIVHRHHGNVSRIAAELCCSRRQAKRWLDHYGLTTTDRP